MMMTMTIMFSKTSRKQKTVPDGLIDNQCEECALIEEIMMTMMMNNDDDSQNKNDDEESTCIYFCLTSTFLFLSL
jgi:hypothetical protein